MVTKGVAEINVPAEVKKYQAGELKKQFEALHVKTIGKSEAIQQAPSSILRYMIILMPKTGL